MNKRCSIERFGDVIHRTEREAVLDVRLGTATGNEDDRRISQSGVLFQVLTNLKATDAGQINVQRDEVEVTVPRELNPLSARLGGNNAASVPFEEKNDCVQHVRVIFNDKNVRFHKLAKKAESQYCYAGVTIKPGVAARVKTDFWPCPGRNIQRTLSALKFARHAKNWG